MRFGFHTEHAMLRAQELVLRVTVNIETLMVGVLDEPKGMRQRILDAELCDTAAGLAGAEFLHDLCPIDNNN